VVRVAFRVMMMPFWVMVLETLSDPVAEIHKGYLTGIEVHRNPIKSVENSLRYSAIGSRHHGQPLLPEQILRIVVKDLKNSVMLPGSVPG
jgi:hypothetical protein